MNICIYLRKSRKDKADEPEEETLRRHEVALLSYAKEHKLNVIDIKKEVRSGESLAKRPQMILMLEEIEERKYDAILVMDIDRLTRGEMLDQGIIISTFKRNDTKIITLEKTYNLDDELDEEMVDFNAFFARKEFKMINKRLSRGRISSIKEGNYIGGFSPYGYDYSKATKKLTVKENEADIVKMIYDMYINKDMGHRKITNFLINAGIKTNRNKVWNEVMTRRILTNPLYTGKVSWSKNTASPLVCIGKHEALISENDFKTAQDLANNRYVPRIKDGYELKNPLTQLVVCSNCNIKMGLRTTKNEPDMLRCKNSCGNKSNYIKNVEMRILETTYDYLCKTRANFGYKIKNDDNSDSIKKNIKLLNKELEKAHEQRNKLFDLLEQGVYDNSTFLERMNIVKDKIESLQGSIFKLTKELSQLNKASNKITMPEIIYFIDYIDNIYEKSTAEERNVFLKKIIKYAVYSKIEKGPESFKIKVFFNF